MGQSDESDQSKQTSDEHVIKCVVSDCSWSYSCRFGSQESMQIIKMHLEYDHRPPESQTTKNRLPKFEAPTLDTGIDQETWIAFTLRWEQYCKGSGIDENLKSLQLFQCATETLGNLLLKANPKITECTPEVMLEEMHRLAVIQTAKSVARADLMRMTQANDEPFRTFAARVQGKAQVCGFATKAKCPYGCEKELKVDYTVDVVKDVIMAGISDEGVRTSVLETEAIEERSLNDLISLVERREKARKAYSSASVSAVSSFKRQKDSTNKPPNESPKIPCPGCRKIFRRFNGRNFKPFEKCINCFRASKPGRNHRRKSTACISSEEIEAALLQRDEGECNCIQGNRSIISCYTLNELRQTGRAHPKIALSINPAGSEKFTNILGVADTGAQADLMGWQDFVKAGFDKNSLKNIPLMVRAANHQVIDLVGGFVANLEGRGPNGVKVKCQSLVLVSNAISGLYVSFDTLIKLKVISSDFPSVGRENPIETCSTSTSQASEDLNPKKNDHTNQGCSNKQVDDSPCKCPQRSAVPLRPKTLPYEPIPENNEKMRSWLLSYFGSSTFNTCPHRPLQEMAGPPIEIHVSEDAVPRVCNTPAHIPLHWQEKVYEDIKRDEALGILERVPYGEPVTWCHRLVVTRKHDGSPRRTAQ